MASIILNGITWGHSRGITPLLAVSQRYNELHPNVDIRWKKRSLQAFADMPIENLTKEYDLLIIDHPWVGSAAASNCVLPLEDYIERDYLLDQLENTVGYSHKSYHYTNKQWALAIDAATPAASFRKDLMDSNNEALPQTWEQLIRLAKKGKVAVPAIAIDLLMNFYTLCIACNQEPFLNEGEVVEMQVGIQAIEMMKELYSLVDKKMFDYNPIKVAEIMTSTDEYWYCPFAYCYSNYARVGYAKNLLHYADVVSINNKKLRTTIGGTGIAVSAFSNNKDEAIDFASMLASGLCQSTMYVQHGGQPGHLAAWKDETANALTNNFFKTILPIMENGYVRPRYNGYLHFQDLAGEPLRDCLMQNGSAINCLHNMNLIYQESLAHKKILV